LLEHLTEALVERHSKRLEAIEAELRDHKEQLAHQRRENDRASLAWREMRRALSGDERALKRAEALLKEAGR
jgi:hypothetical protein